VGALIVRVAASYHGLRSRNRLEGRPAADDSRRSSCLEAEADT
jgi:hypothetical protein